MRSLSIGLAVAHLAGCLLAAFLLFLGAGMGGVQDRSDQWAEVRGALLVAAAVLLVQGFTTLSAVVSNRPTWAATLLVGNVVLVPVSVLIPLDKSDFSGGLVACALAVEAAGFAAMWFSREVRSLGDSWMSGSDAST